LPLSGSATIRFSIMPLASASCDSAILLAEYDATLTTGVLAILDDLYDLSPEALAIIATGNFTICVQITSDVAGEFALGEFDFSFGGTTAGEFLMVNADTVENIHILLPGEDFDPSNRLTPGSRRTATLSGLDIGDSVTVRAGRNSTVLNTTTCPTVTGSAYQATVTWDGVSVTCTATQEGGEDDIGITPGTTIQVPIDNDGGDAVVAPVTLTEGRVDYGVVGVVEAQTPDVTATPIDTSFISFDLAELGLESVQTLHIATHSAFVPDIPNGVTVATLTVAYAEGGTPTTLALVLGSNTSEWSFERPEHGTVPHDLVTTLYDFQTTIDSASEYTGRVFSVTLPVDATRTIACLSLTMSPSSTFAALRPPDSPTGGWAGQAISAITLEGTAGRAFVVGSCETTGDGLDDDDDGLCVEQADCAAGELCTPDGVCLPVEFGTDGILGEDCSGNDLCNAVCGDTDPDCAFCGDDETDVCMEGCPGIDPDCTCGNCPGECFDDVCFVRGAISYADAVITYDPTFGGNEAPSGEDTQTPEDALGAPDYDGTNATHVTLGQGGLLELAFTDNVLTNSGDSQFDLRVFEVGPDVEATFVSIRATAATRSTLSAAGILPDGDWFEVGRIEGSTRNVDIDAAFPGFGPGELEFDAVRLIDDKDQGSGAQGTPGADIDAVGAIATRPV
jgi:hypothetical protein